MEIVLYYAPNACSLVPYVTLTEAQATFEVRPLNFRKGQQNAADYLKLNPKHKVPLLLVDRQPLTENVAIQIFIARTFPQAKLLPADPWQGVAGDLDHVMVCVWDASVPVAHQLAGQGVRFAECRRKRAKAGDGAAP
jgi:glutathione S-transferase